MKKCDVVAVSTETCAGSRKLLIVIMAGLLVHQVNTKRLAQQDQKAIHGGKCG